MQEDAVIPSNVFMHTLVIKMQDKVFYVTSVFGELLFGFPNQYSVVTVNHLHCSELYMCNTLY